jgi:hypothetical protein
MNSKNYTLWIILTRSVFNFLIKSKLILESIFGANFLIFSSIDEI